MKTVDSIRKPSKSEQRVASISYATLSTVIEQMKTEEAAIEIDKTNKKIQLPLSVLKLLIEILKSMSEGKPISIVPVATEITTQKAAEILGCSRPFIVKLLEDGIISYNKIGKHRRVKLEDIMNYQKMMKVQQKQHLIDIMQTDEETGLYDT